MQRTFTQILFLTLAISMMIGFFSQTIGNVVQNGRAKILNSRSNAMSLIYDFSLLENKSQSTIGGGHAIKKIEIL